MVKREAGCLECFWKKVLSRFGFFGENGEVADPIRYAAITSGKPVSIEPGSIEPGSIEPGSIELDRIVVDSIELARARVFVNSADGSCPTALYVAYPTLQALRDKNPCPR